MRLEGLAVVRARYGYQRLQVLLRREGWVVNHQRLHRVYAEAGCRSATPLPRRKRAWRIRQGRPQIGGANEVWSLDFMADQLFGRPAVPDPDCAGCPHARGALDHAESQFQSRPDGPGAGSAGLGSGASRRACGWCNGPEFAGRLLDYWAYLNQVEIDFSRPGTPTDNAFIEAFNARLRGECLNAPWFPSLSDARERTRE